MWINIIICGYDAAKTKTGYTIEWGFGIWKRRFSCPVMKAQHHVDKPITTITE